MRLVLARRVWAFCFWGLVAPIFASEPFSLVVLPDTQYCTEQKTPDLLSYFQAQTGWIVSNREARNIRFVLHEGDLTQTTFTTKTNRHEWGRAQACLRVLEGVVPYAVGYGNHDLCNTGWQRDTSLFNEYFPLSTFSNQPTYGGCYQAGKSDNTYHRFSAGGVDWLVLALEFAPREPVMAWAGQVAAAHSNHAVIVLTHTLLYPDDTLHGSKSSHEYDPHESAVMGEMSGGTEVWDKFIRRHPNIVFTFNGHVLGPGLCVTNGDYGNVVCLMVANYQHESNGGSGYMRILNFDPTQREVRVETYSPKLGQFKTDTRNAFTLTNLPFFEPGLPAIPEQVEAEVLSAKTCRVTWALPPGGVDEVSRWVICRNGAEVGISAVNVWMDEALLPNTTNRYRVRAFNPAGRKSDWSEEVAAVLPPESSAPKLVSATETGSTNLVLVFDRPLNEIFATTAGNYAMGRGSAVLAARLEPDERTVILTTTPRLPAERYPLKIQHLQPKETTDRSEDQVIRIVVQDRVDLLVEDFDDGNSQGWTVVQEGNLSGPCAWAVMTNRLWQTSIVHGPTWGAVVRRRGTYAYWSDPAARQWTDYALQATVHATYDGGAGLMFRFLDTNNFYRFEMDNRFRFRKLFRMVNGQEDLLAWSWGSYAQNSNQVLRVELEGSSISVLLNGSNVFNRVVEDDALRSGSVGLYGWRNTLFFDDVAVQSLPSRIVLNDPPEGMTGEWIQRLVDADPDDLIQTENDVVFADDYDGDGFSNEEEFWAATDPVNAQSFFHVASSAWPVDERVVLQWPSASNRIYMLMRSNKLCQGFQTVAEDIPSTAPMNTYTDHPPVWASLFYRVAVRP